MADLCLDEYTDHGHCGLLRDDGSVDNDATLERYAAIALAQADAGADVVAPSGMMDGQVAAIRDALESAGHHDTIILAYAAKYATALYGPFRDAVDVTIASGDRRGYQQDLRNRREAAAEVLADVAEGADLVMVKPALSCLDVIADVQRARRRAGRRLPRERRVRDGEGGRRARLDRRHRRRARAPDRDPPCRCRRRAHLLRRGGRRGASVAESNAQWFERARRVLPGGVDSPVRSFASVGGTPYTVASGRGATVTDVEGTTYVDYVQSYGASLLGHADPAGRRAIRAAAGDGTTFGAPTRREVLLAEAICERVHRRRAGPLRVVGDRGGDERGAARARRDGPIDGSSSSTAATTATPTRCSRGGQRRRDARPSGLRRRPRGRGRRHGRRPLQRRPRARRRRRLRDRRARRGEHGPRGARARLPRGAARGVRPCRARCSSSTR